MPVLYPALEPYESGMLDVGGGNQLYWEACGDRDAKPAVVLHGGPGSGCSPWFRRLFDPAAYRIVLFDQRNCGRSRPHAGAPSIDLSHNDTEHLIEDVERVRRHLGIERWLVMGGSWGCTLAIAYAERHPDRVAEMVLFGITTGRRAELDWLFRGGLSRFFPEQWDRLVAATPAGTSSGHVADAYAALLADGDADVRRKAAESWCMWESATPHWPPTSGLDARFHDPGYALAFARIVTHYVRNNLFLEDGQLLRSVGALADIPAVLVNGRFDFQSPIANAWELKRAWPRADLVIVDQAGHAAGEKVGGELVEATDRFAR